MNQISFVLLLIGLCSSVYSADRAEASGIFEIREVSEKATADTLPMELAGKGQKEILNISKTTLLNGSAVRSAALAEDPITGAPMIEIAFSNVGAQQFADLTGSNLNRRLAILLEGKLQSAPVVRTRIPGGRAQITGNFTRDEAREMVRRINRALEYKDDRIIRAPEDDKKLP